MQKKFILMALLLPLSAQAKDFYVSTTGEYIPSAKADGKLSANNVSIPASIDFKDGWGGLAALGYNINQDFRTELEIGYREFKEKNHSITSYGTTFTEASSATDKTLTGMTNIYYDMPTGQKVTPYFGAGMGIAHLNNRGHSNAFAYQGMAGLNYKVSQNTTLFGGYRYFATTDFENRYPVCGIGNVTEKGKLEAHVVDVGYRINF